MSEEEKAVAFKNWQKSVKQREERVKKRREAKGGGGVGKTPNKAAETIAFGQDGQTAAAVPAKEDKSEGRWRSR